MILVVIVIIALLAIVAAVMLMKKNGPPLPGLENASGKPAMVNGSYLKPGDFIYNPGNDLALQMHWTGNMCITKGPEPAGKNIWCINPPGTLNANEETFAVFRDASLVVYARDKKAKHEIRPLTQISFPPTAFAIIPSDKGPVPATPPAN